MALLRPCRSLARAFSKWPLSCQVEYFRGVVCFARAQGYVTVAPIKSLPNTNNEKLELPNNNNINRSKSPNVPKLKPVLKRRLVSLCQSATNGKIRKEDLFQLVENSSGGKNLPDQSLVGLAVLRNCGNILSFIETKDRRNLVRQVWDVITEKASTLTPAHYNTLLQVHLENRQSVDPRHFLESMTVKPDNTTYRLLLDLAAKNGEVESALYVFSIMKNDGWELNVEVFNFLIEVHMVNKDIKSALSTLETMKESGVEPTTQTHAKIACGYAALGDIKNTMKIVKEHSLSVLHIIEIVKRLSSSGRGQYIPEVLSYLPSPIYSLDPIFVDTIKAIIYAGYPEDAYAMIDCLIDVIPTDSHPVYEAFLKHMVYAQTPNSVILEFANKILIKMKYSLAMADVCQAALEIGERELAMATFELMQDLYIDVRPHYYWPLLVRASKTHGESDIFRILKHMLCLNVPVDHHTLHQNVLPFINTVDPLVTLRKLNDLGIEISMIFTPLICYLLYQGRLKEALTLCYKIRAPLDFSKVIRPLTIAYKCDRNISDCAKMFKFAPPNEHYPDELLMYVFGKHPSPRNLTAFKNFRQAFKNLGIPLLTFPEDRPTEKHELASEEGDSQRQGDVQSVKSPKIPHPLEMNLDELECHLIELRAKGMNDRGALKRLLQLHCRESNSVERVEEIRKEFEENGYPWTPGMYSSLLQFYARTGEPLQALRLYHHVQKNYVGFKIDDFKILLLATSLASENYVSETIQLLQSNHSTGGNRISKDCWRLLNTVVRSSNSELTESILDILVNNGFCERNNTTLDPLVREHLLKNDLPAAVGTFIKCTERYKAMPLRQELVTALVTEMNADTANSEQSRKMLEEIQTACADIIGNGPFNIDLFIGFASNGMTDDLRRFLEKHRISSPALIKSLKSIPEERQLSILKTILDNTTPETLSLDRLAIYEHLLSLHSRTGNCEQAVELWKKMMAENTKPSQKLRKQFVGLLGKHKYPLPEDFDEIKSL